MADKPNIELINDKWQNVLPQYESNWFELAIVDPPYGIGDFNQSDVKHQKISWNNETPNNEYFNELKRVSAKQIIWGANYFNCFDTGAAVVWYKEQPHPCLSKCEIASLSFGKKVDYVKISHQKYITDKNESGENRVHPCQKPVALYKWLLTNYANEGDRILDTHLGSGSSAIAAWQKKHDFVGIECDKEYFNDMLHRYKKNTDPEYALQAWQEQSEQSGQQTIFSDN